MACLLTVLALLAAQSLTPPAAGAAPGPVVQRSAGAVTADALPTVQVDGVVWAQVVIGTTVYAGGRFTSARPAGAAPGTSQVARSNLLAYDIRTGVMTGFAPTVNAPVKALAASADGSQLFVGGQFTAVNGANRYRFAAFSVPAGTLQSAAPAFDSTVSAIAVTSSAVYLGGIFSRAGGSVRTRLAAVSPTTRALLGWAPTADSDVHALVVTPDRSRVVMGGSFTRINGSTALGMGAVDARTAALQPWKINTVVRDFGDGAAILSLSADADTVYGTGYAYGGGNFEGVFAADPTTGAVRWLQGCHGDTYGVVPVGETVYSVGHAHYCGNIGGFPSTATRVSWRALAVTKAVTGTVNSNGESGPNHGNFAGRPAPSLTSWFPQLDVGTFTDQNQATAGTWCWVASSPGSTAGRSRAWCASPCRRWPRAPTDRATPAPTSHRRPPLPATPRSRSAGRPTGTATTSS